MNNELQKYLPEQALQNCQLLLNKLQVDIKIVKFRVTRHGDYRRMPDGRHRITLNATPNRFRFLITLIHEIAHLKAFEAHGRRIKPHGPEWKRVFQHLMLPFLRPEIFPADLLPLLASHFKNPKASSSTDMALSMALKRYDPPSTTLPVIEIPQGDIFQLYNGKRFERGHKRIKRIECIEIATGKLYLFQPNAEVVWIKKS